MMMKKLTRIRLINWHYFTNETIDVNGSFLITGENTAGKSTILDAIQLVLTTNTRKFNTAANEKSKRDLKGYVRCKTGDEDNEYLRKGSVITYVALEFFEEKRRSYFTIGVKIDSADVDSRLVTKWFVEECRLDDLSFLTDHRPSMSEDFRRNNRKVILKSQNSEAKLMFGRRLGNLDDRFFDITPKSVAFKPMDKVKDFINKFILSERTIEVESLRKNIYRLKDFEDLMTKTKAKMGKLEKILEEYNEIETKEREIRINNILLMKAEIEGVKQRLASINKDIHLDKRALDELKVEEERSSERYKSENNRLNNLRVAHANNEMTKLINGIENDLKSLDKDHVYLAEKLNTLNKMVNKLIAALKLLSDDEIVLATKDQIETFLNPKMIASESRELLYDLKYDLKKFEDIYDEKHHTAKDRIKKDAVRKSKLEKEIKDLRDKKLPYPINTVILKKAIEEEFCNQGIECPVRIFSDLLEITDPAWQNAIEGYLNNQRFYIIVEPKYYQNALETYHKVRDKVHSVGLINTAKLDLDTTANRESLAYLISSNNRYANSYAHYLLNRVIRCRDVHELKNHKIAITSDCMLYQNFAVRKIDKAIYETPFIGSYAYKVQLETKEKELIELEKSIELLKNKNAKYKELLEAIRNCNMETIDDNIDVPKRIEDVKKSILQKEKELDHAKNNPNYIEIQIEIEKCEKLVDKYNNENKRIVEDAANKRKDIEYRSQEAEALNKNLNSINSKFLSLCKTDELSTNEGLRKYAEESKTKTPAIIIKNFTPRLATLQNQRGSFVEQLIILQTQFCNSYDAPLGSGTEAIPKYKEEYHKLVSSEIVKYEGQLEKAKQDCELEFKESFLARLKENIQSAQIEFNSLNKALKGIYYGEDSYKFEIESNKNKRSLYKMIMSEHNFGGHTLFSSDFDNEYKEEMNDLFEKLTAYDDLGEKVIKEYTDYRSYLDYDITVMKKNGNRAKFSNIYGEKSGGETQTPYYVAIAASFVQLYKLGDTIRVIMLDEAFDKMDDNRISSMMDFFNSQKFQIIIATTPSKMEVIGEKVDTILMAIREGNQSIIEVYDYEG